MKKFSSEQVVETIRLSGLFDADFYTSSYPDHVVEDRDALIHYLRIGTAKGYDPNPYFNTLWYLANYPDVASLGVNPLWHYISYGSAEYRRPCELFDARRYLEIAGPPAWTGGLPLGDFLTCLKSVADDSPAHIYLGELLTKDLDLKFYGQYYHDVKGMKDVALMRHYLTVGRVEGRYLNAERTIAALESLNGTLPVGFDEMAYLAHHDSVARQYPYPGGGIIHYLQFGRAEGLKTYTTRSMAHTD